MFNPGQWYLNDYQDTANYVYAPTGISSVPPTFEFEVINPCSKGVYTGEIVLLGCDAPDGTGYKGHLGLGSVFPQQKLDVAGSVKIDEFVYDSVNAKGKNGYILSVDVKGIRWLPPTSSTVAGTVSNLPGIGGSSEGIFILNEGVPIY